MKNPIAVFFMGLSGSGKDTQAVLLKEFLEKRDGRDSVLYVYTGEELRRLAQERSYTGGKVQKEVMETGAKAPDFLALYAWTKFLIENLGPAQHLIFSSSPRTEVEAMVMDDAMVFYDRKPVYPIYINVVRDEAFKRLKARGRADDTDEVIANRLDYFEKAVAPAIEYYRAKSENKLVEIDGNPHDIHKIHGDIMKALGL